MRNPSIHSEADCEALLLGLLKDEQTLQTAIAPDGLDRSPLRPFVGAAQSGERHRWLRLLGVVLWEVFSSNHEVRSADGRLYDLGSWRGSGRFIADMLNRHYANDLDHALGYLDFYCGFAFFAGPTEADEDSPHGEADDEPLRPLFRYVFERLKAQGCTWAYAPPALGLVRFTQPQPPDDPATYDPSEAVRSELEQQEHEEQARELEEGIARSNAQARERAAEHPPLTVRMYREVYGHWPEYLGDGPEPQS